MTDLLMGGGDATEPAWAKLPFLERGSIEVNKDRDPKSLHLDEIEKL